MVATQHPVAQRATTDDLADLQHEKKYGGDHEGEDDGDDLGRAGLDRNADQAGAWLVDVHQRYHRAIDAGFDRQRDQEGGLFDRAPWLGTDPEDLQPPDRGAEQKAVDSADACADKRGAKHGELQDDSVDGAHQRAEGDNVDGESGAAPRSGKHRPAQTTSYWLSRTYPGSMERFD